MNLRHVLIAAGLATLAGCAVGPDWGDEGAYGPGYPVYRDTDAYGGYFYVQIVYIDGEPWYVDDDRRAHPVPPHLRSHFRQSGWARSLPPRFGHDDDVRDGYRLSRIVYVNDVPLYVDDDRRARPLPVQERSRFSYQGVVRPRDAGRTGREPQALPQPRYDNAPRPLPPASGREPERPQSPAYGRERQTPPADGRVQERGTPPDYGRERDRSGPPSAVPQPLPRPAAPPERVREMPQGRPQQPADRDDRGQPPGRGAEQLPDRGATTGRPPSQGRGRKADDGQRPGGADARKNGQPSGNTERRKDDGQGTRRGVGDPGGN
ncbi:hypothetical protein [Thiobacillus sedimenti]|uniref:Lipoprotein n=1 Tax=Thiobacillus sedimenti TaxID=3110231 RepID=A0ABZ1CEZ7_9PROT|nr:hypothetical protein [Thiobacillus sp. SCUT-2]WRS37948.1 hypothetical protein VA613_07920 [Thiobacillus sp. SCUT-2]